MAWRPHGSDFISFPTPNPERDIVFPGSYYDSLIYPLDGYRRARALLDPNERRLRYHAAEHPHRQAIGFLRDRNLDQHGDLGWSLDYATAWCYKHLIGSQTEVSDTIDRVRRLENIDKRTPFIIFDYLDKALFCAKLKGMVYMQWKGQATVSPGTTSAHGVIPGVPRICIELNKTPFEDDQGEMDDLLDALIHQMIHAFFIVCCGAQQKGEKQDGRLMDGLHFGVIMHTIKDITRQCAGGVLDLIFYAAQRRMMAAQGAYGQASRAYGAGMRGRGSGRRYIALDPRGTAVPPAPADGQSHCSHDNRKIRLAQIKNWQVEEYSRSIDQEYEARGTIVHDLDVDRALVPIERIKAPPSSTYCELIWDNHRIMVPRDKTIALASLARPLKKYGKMELIVPACPKETFVAVYDYINLGHYHQAPQEAMQSWNAGYQGTTTGAPVLVNPTPGQIAQDGIVNHLKVFKLAEAMKFEELQLYVLKRLHDTMVTHDDPILIFKELYNDGSTALPIHAELHKWSRAFLTRTEGMSSQSFGGYGHAGYSYGTSNYEKILSWFQPQLEELYYRSAAFKDDVKLAVAELMLNSVTSDPNLGESGGSSQLPYALTAGLSAAPPLSRARSWSYPRHALNAPPALPSPYDSSPYYPYQQESGFGGPRMLDWNPAPASSNPWGPDGSGVSYKYYGRDGRLKMKNVLTGGKYIRRPRSFGAGLRGYGGGWG